MSTPVFVDPESSTHADEAQSSRVPMPLPEDPYEAIRQAYLDGTDTESEPFKDPIDTETPESLLAIAPPIPLSESTPPVLVLILRRTAHMVGHVPHEMSSGLSAGMAEMEAMSESAFRKRFRSSCESSLSVSPPDLPSRKSYCGTSELVEDNEEDDDEEDEEIKEKDENPATEDEGLTARVEDPGMDDEDYGLDDEICGIDDEGYSVESDGLGLEEEEEEAVPGGQQQATPVVRTTVLPTLTTWTDPEDGMIYIDIPDYPPPTPPVQTPPSPEWTSGSLPISPSHSDISSLISSPMVPLTVLYPVATPATAETEGFLTELGAQVEMDIEELFTRSGRLGRRFSPRGQTDAQRAALWHAISDVQGDNQDLRLQLAEERRAQLELAEVIDGMRRGQEPRGGDIVGRGNLTYLNEVRFKTPLSRIDLEKFKSYDDMV
ncbi:hypothetical protein Tco_1151316 [Tanacetum coccineum]